MADRRTYKTDASFLEKLVIGATGTKAVYADLQRQGHRPIELERGSMSFKIWKKIKIKRLRVPDLLCLNCGLRVEARAKTDLEISMSHSLSDPERAWDRGLQDGDVAALALCKRVGLGPTDWEASGLVQYVAVSSLRDTYQHQLAVTSEPKGSQEAFEVRVTWPSAVATSEGVVREVTGERVQIVRTEDNRRLNYALRRRSSALTPLVQQGDNVRAGQIVASVVPVSSSFPCRRFVTADHFIGLLNSSSIPDRYTATKALPLFGDDRARPLLQQRMTDENEHIYIRMEAAAGLTRMGDATGMRFIEQAAGQAQLQPRLEAIIILGELRSDEAEQLLIRIIGDRTQDAEIRGGAAWALGELGRRTSVDALIRTFTEIDETVRVEAVRALRKVAAASARDDVLARLPGSVEAERAGIAWAISRSGGLDVEKLVGVMVDDDARRWVAYIIGTQQEQQMVGRVEALREEDSEVYFAATVLWKIFASWIRDVEEH
jgi:hypothetical protein